MQSFVLDSKTNPFNVVEPGKRPRVTLTPTLATKDGKPFLSFAVQGGDSQEQFLLQFFLNVVEFGMNVQEASEAANFIGYQMKSSFGAHVSAPGRIDLDGRIPKAVADRLATMGYKVRRIEMGSGPLNAIQVDNKHQSYWGGSSIQGEDYGIGW